jgi:hypothetical protein
VEWITSLDSVQINLFEEEVDYAVLWQYDIDTTVLQTQTSINTGNPTSRVRLRVNRDKGGVENKCV